jgi:hypothetical protein
MPQRNWHWEVRVLGEPRDLEHVAARLQRDGFTLRRDDDGWWLRSNRADTTDDPREAFETVRSELATVSGVLKVTIGSSTPLRPGGVIKVHADGHREYTLVVTRGLRLHGRISDDGGTRLRELAERDAAVAKSLRLLVAEDYDSWTGIYRLLELIEHDVGGKGRLLSLGWISESDRSRLKHSANSVAVGGDVARHGAEKRQPPSKPMGFPEAQACVEALLQSWLSDKR